MKLVLKLVLPLLILALGAGVAHRMVQSRKPVAPREVLEVAPLVRVMAVQSTNVQLTVASQGTVLPGTEIQLISEVAGTIIRVSPALGAGGYFEKGDVLLEIDPVDYELAVVQARARKLEADARLLREEAEAEVARAEWKELGKDGEASPLLLREPQLAEARAVVESAVATLKQAERNLAKTKLKAPFTGRILSTSADLGQYVPVGAQLARIYSVETAEVRLPVMANDLAYVRLPFTFLGEERRVDLPRVILSASLGGVSHEWIGTIVRTEGEIDPRTRMITAVAEVENPYARMEGPNRAPLAAGLFVEAEIMGRKATNVFVVPRAAMLNRSQLLVVDDGGRVRFRDVGVLRAGRTETIIESGLKDGELVCLTPLEAPVDNMKVRIAEEAESKATNRLAGGLQ